MGRSTAYGHARRQGRCGPRAASSAAAPLLDSLSVAPAGLWCRSARLFTTYTGALTRVRRSSDNTEQDVPYLATFLADRAGMTTFCGANNGFETTLYDQSGNGRNLTQATTANQPKLNDSAGGANLMAGDLAANYDNSNDAMTRADRCGLGAVAPAITLWAVWTTSLTTGFPVAMRVGTTGVGGALLEVYMDNSTTQLGINIGGAQAKFTCNALNAGVNAVVVTQPASSGVGSARAWLNGTELTLSSSVNPANTITALGNATGNGFSVSYGAISGNVDCMGLWGAVLGAADIARLFAASTSLHGVP